MQFCCPNCGHGIERAELAAFLGKQAKGVKKTLTPEQRARKAEIFRRTNAEILTPMRKAKAYARKRGLVLDVSMSKPQTEQ